MAARDPLSVLIADDSAAMRQLLGSLLRRNGIDIVLEAADGESALQVLAHADPQPDILFCDLAMPGMDGVDALRRIAQSYPGTAVVPFSGLEPRLIRAVSEMSEQLGLEVLGVLGKPFSEAELRGLLTRYRRARLERMPLRQARISPADVEQALAEDRIEVYYQPQTRLANGEVTGFEALARLRHPEHGVIGAAAFIPVAESAGQIHALTQRVVEKALGQAGLWARSGLALTLSVNLAPSSMRGLSLPDAVARHADRAGVARERVTFEITETRGDVGPEVLHNASRLRMKGFGLAVDDYGTGDSGLLRLQSLPFTELKIDQAFVTDAGERDDLRGMLESSIGLGHRLNMSVVAEGVESWDDWNLLRSYGCDLAQGFLMSPALPAAHVEAHLQQWRGRLATSAARAAHRPH